MSILRYYLYIAILAGCSQEKEKTEVNNAEVADESIDATSVLPNDTLVSTMPAMPTAMVVDDEDSLPDCTEDNKGQMVFVKAIKNFKYCDSSWVDIDIKGEKGEQGETGGQGERGVQGEKGDRGEKGDEGAQGTQGETGQTGEKGEQGDQGMQGEKGDTGEQGGLLEAKIECPSSGKDLDSNSQFDIYGDGATIYQFADGSYQMVTYSYFEEYALDGTFIDSDVSTTMDRFVADELVSENIVQLQDLSLVFRYNVMNQTITYMNLNDFIGSSLNPQQTIVQCEKIL